MGAPCPTGHRWPLEALFGEAHSLAINEATAGVRQSEEWREPGDLTHCFVSSSNKLQNVFIFPFKKKQFPL